MSDIETTVDVEGFFNSIADAAAKRDAAMAQAKLERDAIFDAVAVKKDALHVRGAELDRVHSAADARYYTQIGAARAAYEQAVGSPDVGF